MPIHREHGTWRLWPLSWVFNTDRDEQCKITGVNKAPEGRYSQGPANQPNAYMHPSGNARSCPPNLPHNTPPI